MKKVYVFPGQGSQRRGMGEGLFEKYPDLVAQADDCLGYSLRELCLRDPNNVLHRTEYTQPALYAVNVLHYLDRRAREPGAPDFVAGHSLGEYCALFAAGAFDFVTGLRLVQRRGALMARAPKGAMAAVVKLDEARVRSVLAALPHRNIEVANINSRGQLVLSGAFDEVHSPDVRAAFTAAGGVFVPLNVSAAFHSRSMAGVEREFASFLANFRLGELTIAVVANLTARPYPKTGYAQHLERQIASPVRWYESISWLVRQGGATFHEIGPGDVLTKLCASIVADPMRDEVPTPLATPRPSAGPPSSPGRAASPASRPSFGPASSPWRAAPPAARPSAGPASSPWKAAPPASRPAAGPSSSGWKVAPPASRPTAGPSSSGWKAAPPASHPTAGPSSSGWKAAPPAARPSSGPSSSRWGATGPSSSRWGAAQASRPTAGPSSSGWKAAAPASRPAAGPSSSGWKAAAPASRPSASMQAARRTKVIFMYGGQGSQYYQMGRALYDENATFRRSMAKCSAAYEAVRGTSLVKAIYDESQRGGEFDDIECTHPAIYAIGYSLTEVLRHEGVQPDGVIGYSLGEYVALTVAGALSFHDAFGLVMRHADVFKRRCRGAMVSVLAPRALFERRRDIFAGVTLAAVNFGDNFVVSGEADRLHRVQAALEAEGVIAVRLPVRYGFHSELMAPARDEIVASGARVAVGKPHLPVYSAAYARALGDDALGRFGTYLWDVLRGPIRFHDLMQDAFAAPEDYYYVDLSPSGSFTNFLRHGFGGRYRSAPAINQFGNNGATMTKLRAELASLSLFRSAG